MDHATLIAFLVMVFGTVFFVAQLIIVPTFGTSRLEKKRLQQRLESLEMDEPGDAPIVLLRERFRRKPSLSEKLLAWLPGIQNLVRAFEEPGRTVPVYEYILVSLLLALLGMLFGWAFTGNPLVALGAGLGLGLAPLFKLKMENARRFAQFEDQLPGALEVMTRALIAGYPFTETLRQVAKEMDDPIASEFRATFDEINAGVEVRRALRNLLTRMPSMTLMAISTTVMLQRETGGNLAESLTNIGGLIRGRYKFQRSVRTLTAEGRMSAWVLSLMPFFMFGVLSYMMPEQVRAFVADPLGQKMIMTGLGLMVAGIFWLRALINIDI